jgi:hypothetical protein
MTHYNGMGLHPFDAQFPHSSGSSSPAVASQPDNLSGLDNLTGGGASPARGAAGHFSEKDD